MSKSRREEFVYEPGEMVPQDVIGAVIPGSVKKIPADAFRCKSALEEVVLKEGVIEIGENAFICCESLRHLRLPSTLLRIGKLAFSRTSLRELNLPEGITALGPSSCAFTFCRCDLLREVSFPEGFRSIGDGAFMQCKSLENIVLPSTLNRIGHQAFACCNSLRMVELTGGIQIMLREAFDECDSLDHIRVPCKSLVITGNSGGENFVLVRDRFAPPTWGDKKLVIASECFNSICPAEMSNIEIAITGILGEEIMRSDASCQCNEWDDKRQQLCAMLAPKEKQHKNKIASLLELRLWKAEMEKAGEDVDSRIRTECRLKNGVEMIQENVLSFLHFL